MRIQLSGDEQGRRGRKKTRRRRRRSRTYETALTLTQAQAGKTSRKGRGSAKRNQAKRSRAGRDRAARRRQMEKQEVSSPGRALPAIRWRTLALRIPALLILLALVGIGIYVSTDARFFVYDAQIVGRQHLEAEKIYQAAGVHEQNIFWVDPQAVAERIMQLDGIKGARVHSKLPAMVTIEVEERDPVVMWRATTQQEDLWLDSDGVVLPYHGDVNSPDMIFVVDYGERHLQVGDHIEPEGIVQSSLKLAASVPGVKVFVYQPGWGLSFTQGADRGDWPVYVGTIDDLPRKIQVLQTLTDYLQTNNVRPRYVDVRWADHPVYGDRPGETTAEGGN